MVTLWDAASLEEGASRTRLSAAMGHGADFFHNKPSMFVKETLEDLSAIVMQNP